MASNIKWTGEGITDIKLYKKRWFEIKGGYGIEHIPFVLMHMYSLYHCYLTFGDPYIDRIAELKAEGRVPFNATTEEDISTALQNTSIVLPNPFLPGFLPLLLFSAVLCGHLFLVLFQVWFISVLTFVQYRPCNKVSEASFVKVSPRSHRGKVELVPLERQVDGTETNIFFNFQHHKYIYQPSNETFKKVVSPTRLPLANYLKSPGLSLSDAQHQEKTFGKNIIDIPQPAFKQLFKQQLMQPLTVFQLFSTLLWLLDEYWKYALFSLAMILIFEGVTVFSRFKTLKMLQGMGNSAAKDLQVYRNNQWSSIKSTDLLPGDLMSLTHQPGQDDVIPCDCLLLKGLCVVNEASLSGESHPQMKEEISLDDEESLKQPLDMKNTHKVNLLFGGTSLMQQTATKDQINFSIPNEKPKKKSKSSDYISTPNEGCLVYVLRTGFNSSQGKLVRMMQYSSEHVRSDSWDAFFLVSFLMLFAVSTSSYVLKKGLENKDRSNFELLLHCTMIITNVVPPELPMQTALAVNTALMALMQLHIFCTEPFRIPTAGKIDVCLFDKTGTITADHLNAVGIVGPKAKPSPGASHSSPRPLQPMLQAPLPTLLVLGGCHSLVSINGKVVGDPVEEAAVTSLEIFVTAKGKAYPRKWNEMNQNQIEIEAIHRNHFASKLQLMSVLAKVEGIEDSGIWSLVKGSPEAISKLLRDKETPEWYWNTYKDLTRRGMRVLALGYKEFQDSKLSLHEIVKLPRSKIESDLKFAGFVAFRCPVRKDSKAIVQELKRGSHKVQMITGDATLTATFVAQEVGMATNASKILILQENNNQLCWLSASDDSQVALFNTDKIDELAKEYCLCVSGYSLQEAIKKDKNFTKYIDRISIFARMTPEQKETVISYMKEMKHFCLMCGDGANDVGALKQSHVGVALLSGFGALNVDKKAIQQDLSTNPPDEPSPSPAPTPAPAPAPVPAPPRLTREEIQARLERDINERTARGESCPSFRAFIAHIKNESAEARRIAQQRQGQGIAGHAQRVALDKYLQDMDTNMGDISVKLGDASVAAPFTAKTPSIEATVDIIRQGRCALVTTLQMYQILALNCLISAYSLSVLYLDGIKYGDHQMMASGVLMTISFLTLSRATPLKELSPVRPLTTIFHPALFLSLLGQFCVHLGCMVYVTSLTKQYTPEWSPNLYGQFKPSLLNTVVFLTSTVQSVSVFVVNYKGRPFMVGMPDNPYLLYSLGACLVGVFLAATEQIPTFNKILQLVPFPNAEFGMIIFQVLLFNIGMTLLWDFLMVGCFARNILKENLKSFKTEDAKKMLKMVLVLVTLIWLFTPSEEDYEKLKVDFASLEF